jgi:mRNA-degrading endonuclease HigB of HigAB toxin-antitoxin module
MRLPNGIRIAGSFDHLALDDQARQLENLSETKADFPAADLVGRRTVFNIKGNSYRLLARVNYQTQRRRVQQREVEEMSAARNVDNHALHGC